MKVNRFECIFLGILATSSPGVCMAEIGMLVDLLAPLPIAVSNNAVTSVRSGDREFVITFNGLKSGKTYEDTHALTMVLDSATGDWSEAPAVPGGVGRLAAAAATVGELAYVFGGYSVDEDGGEVSTPWVHAFDPMTKSFAERAEMPVPVDDAVALAYADRFVYLISGWHDLANVNLTQLYDTRTDTWVQATPIPGSPVFGHAGGIVGNSIVYCDGVEIRAHPDRPRDYTATDECYLGVIDESAVRKIDWREIPAHPGPPRYRAAAAGVAELNSVLFLGGTANPYNYNGIGYNGVPSEPQPGGLLFDLSDKTWTVVAQPNAPTMDHRALVQLNDRWLTIGGMSAGQQVSDQVLAYQLDRDK